MLPYVYPARIRYAAQEAAQRPTIQKTGLPWAGFFVLFCSQALGGPTRRFLAGSVNTLHGPVSPVLGPSWASEYAYRIIFWPGMHPAPEVVKMVKNPIFRKMFCFLRFSCFFPRFLPSFFGPCPVGPSQKIALYKAL